MTISEQYKPSSTILVVDDDPINLRVMREQLQGRGFRVATARNGESGLKRADYLRPELILLDVQMPGIDGFETCRRLKAKIRTREIPVIFLTAQAETLAKIKGFDAGGVDYITKPFQEDEMLARVNTHLNLCKLQQQLEARNARLRSEIAERERAEAEAEKNRLWLLKAEDISNQGAWDWDLVNDQWFFSDNWLRIHGCQASGISREEFMAIVYPEDTAIIEESLQNALQGRGPYKIEHRIVRQNDGKSGGSAP